MSDLNANIVAQLRAEMAEYRANADKITESMGSEIMRLQGELEAARSILATWLQWGGHCETCEFVRQRAANPALDTSLFADYCDCGWYLARKAVEGVK